jgi:hypothetical protein
MLGDDIGSLDSSTLEWLIVRRLNIQVAPYRAREESPSSICGMVANDLATVRAGQDGPSRHSAGTVARSPEELVSLELTQAQVEAILRATADTHGPSLNLLLSGLITEEAISEGSLEDRYWAELESGRLSHSLFRGLLILALFISGEEGRGVVEVARQLGLSPSTTHRYMTTLVAFGLLVQDPATRKYRLPL